MPAESLAHEDAMVPTASAVATMFVRQYYTVLSTQPESVRALYAEGSQFTFVDDREDGESSMPVRGKQPIADAIERINLKDCRVVLDSIDAQSSKDGSVIVLVAGNLFKDDTARRFAQTFLLARQTPSKAIYYVHNDIFRYVKEDEFVVEEEEVIEEDITEEAAAEPEAVYEPEPEPEPEAVYEPEPAVAEVVYEPEPVVPEPVHEEVPVAPEPQHIPEPEPVHVVPEPEPAPVVQAAPSGPKLWSSILGGVSAAPARPVEVAPQRAPAQPRHHAQPKPAAPKAPAATLASAAPATSGGPKGPGLFINGLSSATKDHDIRLLFSSRLPAPFRVDGASVHKDRENKDKAFAFVDLSEAEAVRWCLQNGPWVLNGQELNIEEKKPTRRSEGRPPRTGDRRDGRGDRRPMGQRH